MSKFTIFTVILTISVVTVMSDLVVRDYFDEGSGQSSVLSVDGSEDAADVQEKPALAAEEKPDTAPVQPLLTQPAEEQPAAEVYTALSIPPAPTITSDIIKNAGFTGELNEKHFDGKVFQLLDITKTPVEAIGFNDILQENTPIASVTEIALKDEIRALQLYSLLQNKTKTYIDLSLNETNAYGDRSFYINHAKKPDEAFLTVKIGSKLYCFAYVKFYHPELKKLIALLSDK